ARPPPVGAPHKYDIRMFAVSVLLLLSAVNPIGGDSLRASLKSKDSVVVYKSPGEMRIPLVRAPQPPAIDGRLDDAVWKNAQPLTRFVQYEPVDSILPSQQSVGWVTYDAENIYVAFRAYEPKRSDIRATVHPRERGGELDDKIAVSIDTYNDNRRTYVFRVSPIGMQFDGIKTEGQRTDDTPDLVWYSAARVDDEGWTAELQIPFASIRLPQRAEMEFGFDLVRYHGKAGTRSSWSPRRRGSPCDICQQGTLIGINDIHVGRTLDLLPYVSGVASGSRSFGRDSLLSGGAFLPYAVPTDFNSTRPTGTVGLDARFAITPSITINSTINPDFSQVESDDEQIRVNQRFALFYQERRPFFLDGRDVFDVSRQGENGGGGDGGVGGELVYTRAIVNPSTGARVTGKSGAMQFGTLYARDDEPAWFYYDGHESSGVVPQVGHAADVMITRLRRDMLADSWVGMSLLGRRAGSSRNGVAEGDFTFRHGTLVLSGEGALSSERAPFDTLLSREFDGASRSGSFYNARLSQSGRNINWSASTTGLSPEFRNQLGRYTRVGVEGYSARVEFNQYPNGRLLQRVSQSVSASRTNAFGGGLLDMKVNPRLSLNFRQRASVNLFANIERTTLFGREVAMEGGGSDFRLEMSRLVQFGGFFFAGDRDIVDANNPRAGKGYFTSLRFTVRPLAQASIEVKGQRSIHFESWGGELVDDAKIARLRGTYQFTRALGVRVIGEYSDQFNSLVSNPLNRNIRRYSSSVLATYELGPASFLYVGYNDAQQDFAEPSVTRQRVLRTGNQFFLKLSYLFRL
ncbi:MAG: DUF5916 domain-containing protein, partial [Gemmatimonadaceae bacterium]